MSLTNYAATAFLNHLYGRVSFAMPAGYLALFTVVGDDTGAGFTEVSGGGYARQVANGGGVWNAPTGSDPVVISTGVQISFGTPSINWGVILAWGLYDASSSGNLLEWDYLGGYPWLPCFISFGSPCRVYAASHGYSQGDNFVYTTKYGGQSPSFGFSSLTGLLTVNSPTNDLFTPYNGSNAVATTTTGDGMVRKVVTFSSLSGMPVFFNSGALSTSLQ